MERHISRYDFPKPTKTGSKFSGLVERHGYFTMPVKKNEKSGWNVTPLFWGKAWRRSSSTINTWTWSATVNNCSSHRVLVFRPNHTCKNVLCAPKMCSVLLGLNDPWMLWPHSHYLKASGQLVGRSVGRSVGRVLYSTVCQAGSQLKYSSFVSIETTQGICFFSLKRGSSDQDSKLVATM